MKKLHQLYNSLRLQTKFTITHLVIATIPMIVIGIFFYAKLYNMIVSDTIRTEQNASAQTAPMIEDVVDEIISAHRTVTTQDFYRHATNGSWLTSTDKTAFSSEAAAFSARVNSIKSSKQITDVHIYLDVPDSEYIFSSDSTKDIFLPVNAAKGTYWYGIYQGLPSLASLFCPSFYLSASEIEHYGDLAYITKSSMTYKGQRISYFTAIYFSKTQLTNLLKDNLLTNTSVAYIINERDSIIAASNDGLAGTYHLDYDTVQDSFMSSNNFIQKEVLGEEVYAGFNSIGGSDWYMVVAMPARPMIEKSLAIIVGFLLVYIACIVIAFLIANMLSRSITNKLSAVISQMATARHGPPEPMPDALVQDEIGELIGTYNYMTKVIRQLLKEQAESAEELRIAEFNSLQSQINPHFLYNTMDMINWLSQQGRSKEVTQAIYNLSRFYKLTLSKKQNMNTLENESEHVSIYVELQNMRFNNMIEFLVDIPDNLMEYSIPKLTFQPVVENSIIHGIMEKDSKQGTIVLTGWQEDNTVILLISDDGVGICPETLDQILSGKGKHGRGSNIAIYNIHSRLKLLYGPEYGLHYSSVVGKGTEVEIRIPAKIADNTRLEQAVKYLSHPDKNLFQIMKDCGYCDMNEFSLEFKEKLGCSPEEYRRRLL